MSYINHLVLIALLPFLLIAVSANRPRGVAPDFAKFYQSETEFKCIFNPSITLKSSQVNDDYCDCPDGSDEPGTAACSNISPLSPQQPLRGSSINTTLAIPGFYCKNRNHIPTYLPLMSVNDGICDYDLCCDGSDEWAGVGGVKCNDKCSEIGKEWKLKQETHENLLRTALKKRAQLVSKAKSIRSEVETKINNLERETADLEKKVADLKLNYEEIKRRERGRMVKNSGTRKGGKVALLASLVKIRVDQLRQALSQEVSKNEALQKRVQNLEKILSTFKEDYNPNFNDEGVKRAVKAWEDYAVTQKTDENDQDDELDIDTILKEDNDENGIDWSEWENDEESQSPVLYKFEEYLPASIRFWIDSKLVDLRIYLMDNGFLPSINTDELESKEVQDAREAYETASSEKVAKDTAKDQSRADLSRDYGKDEIFRALEGQCLEKDSGEYTYELCWLKETKQKSKKNGVEIKMGTFTGFGTITAEEDEIQTSEAGQVGLGLSSAAKRVTLRYENGQNCWNGPSRETLVVLSCADQDIIWKINEFEKCKYRMDVGSPAVCEIVPKKK